jgi:hypothetical protein
MAPSGRGASFDPPRLRRRPQCGVSPKILRRQRVVAFDVVFQVRRKPAGAECRSVLNTDVVFEEEPHFGGNHRVTGRLTLHHDLEAEHSRVPLLVES